MMLVSHKSLTLYTAISLLCSLQFFSVFVNIVRFTS